MGESLPGALERGPDTNQIVSGSGEFRYEFVPGKLQLPSEVRMKHGHGLCRSLDGHIYFTYEPEKVEADTRVLVRFEPNGTGAALLGNNSDLARGVPHGLSIFQNAAGIEELYHAHNDGTVHKSSLDGALVWSQKWAAQMGNYKPTETAVLPDGATMVVADGYGSSVLHMLKTVDGVYAGRSWGGVGSDHGHFNCPHGVAFDPRRGLLLVADRGNKRLEYFTTNGIYKGTIQAKEITAPCNADFRGDHVLVPDLDGSVVILDGNNAAVSVIEVRKLLGSRGFRHPHDAIWLENGDVVVCTWNPGRIGYWRKL